MYPYYHYYVNSAHTPAYVNNYHPVRHPPMYYPTPFPYHYFQPRSYPKVNPSMLIKSAHKMQVLVQDAALVLGKINASKQFAIDLMSAAQQSDKGKVERMIRSAGVRNFPEITYSPDGLHLKFTGDIGKVDCCHLIIDLRWE